MVADVVVENASYSFDIPFSYRVPGRMEGQIRPGCRVLVPFGRSNRSKQGLVLHLQPQEHGVEPLTVPPEQAVQSKQKQHLRLVLLLAPLTEPFDLQQGLQQDWPTKLGKVMPPQRQELHIRTYLQKRCHGTRIP